MCLQLEYTGPSEINKEITDLQEGKSLRYDLTFLKKTIKKRYDGNRKVLMLACDCLISRASGK